MPARQMKWIWQVWKRTYNNNSTDIRYIDKMSSPDNLMSRQLYRCLKTMKTQKCLCPKLIIWGLSSILLFSSQPAVFYWKSANLWPIVTVTRQRLVSYIVVYSTLEKTIRRPNKLLSLGHAFLSNY